MLAGGSAASDAVEEEEINELDEFGEDLSEASGGEAGPENAAVETEGGSRLSLEARVLNLCHALGGFERETNADGTTDGSSKWTYVLGDECLDCLRDLKRLLRRHDSLEDRSLFRFLGRQRVLNDLIAILTFHPTKERICVAVVELLVPMTWPISSDMEHAPEMLEILRNYKEAFAKPGPFKALFNIMVRIMSIPSADRSNRDNAILRFILVLITNLLSIKDPQATVRSTSEDYFRSHLQDELIARLEEEHILEFLVTLASSLIDFRFQEWNLDLLDIFSLIFQDRDPNDLLSQVKRGSLAIAQEQVKDRAARPAFKSTRHSRFGGAFSIKLGDGRAVNVFQQTGAFVPTEQLLDKGKKDKPQRTPAILETESIKKKATAKTNFLLRGLADAILESAFNRGYYETTVLDVSALTKTAAFMASIKREFDIESTRVRDSDLAKFLGLMSFFLQYQRIGYKESPDADAYNFEGIAAVMNLRMLIFITRKMHLFVEEKQWANLFVALGCFKDMLVSLETMETLEDEQLHGVSETMQHNLFYESARMDLIERMCKNFKPTVNSRSYLVRLVETIHIFMRMLERFSKKKKHMYVKSVRSKPKKKKPVDGNDGTEGVQEDSEDDVSKEKESYREVEFDFQKVEQKFASQAVIATYCILLKEYPTLGDQLLHCITKMFYRISVKQSFDALFFQLSTLKLFSSIIVNRRQLPPCEATKELLQLIQHITRKFVNALSSNPLLGVEIFFGRTRHECRTLEMSAEELRELEAKKLADATIKSDDEVEVKRSLKWSEQIGVAVAVLIDSDKAMLLKWLIQELDEVATKREPTGERLVRDDPAEDEEQDLVEYFDTHYVTTSEDDVSSALKRHSVFRLLLTLVGFEEEREGGNAESDVDDREVDEDGNPIVKVWVLPGNLSRTKLLARKEVIEHYVDNPLRPEGKDASKFLRKKKPRAERKPRERKPKEKKAKEDKNHLSEQFVRDDEESDEDEFFRLEAERRERYRAAAETAVVNAQRERAEAVKEKSAVSARSKAADKHATRKSARPRKAQSDSEATSSSTDESEASERTSRPTRLRRKGAGNQPPKSNGSSSRESSPARLSQPPRSPIHNSVNHRKRHDGSDMHAVGDRSTASTPREVRESDTSERPRSPKLLKRPTIRSPSESPPSSAKPGVHAINGSSSDSEANKSSDAEHRRAAAKRRRLILSDDSDD